MSTAGEGDEVALDRQVRTLVRLEDRLQASLGRLLAGMGERGDWSRLMFAGVGHYGEERLRISRTTALDRARAACLLRSRPRLRAAYEAGHLGLEAALIIARLLGSAPIADGVEEAWVNCGIEATIKRLRDKARALGRRESCLRGSRGPRTRPAPAAASPADPPSAGPPPADAPPASGSGDPLRPLEDREWQASLARPPGRARRRVLRLGLEALLDAGGDLPGCRSGGAVARVAASDDAAAAGAAAEGAATSGPDVFLRFRLPSDLAAGFVAAIESRRRRLTAEVDQVPWSEPWPDPDALPSTLAARTFSTRSRRVPSWVSLLSILEEYVITWDARGGVGAGRGPARSDAIYIRDGWRCTAPGCTSRRNLEDHHLVYRSRGGDDALENRTCLCRFHHQRGEHGGLASCAGTAPLAITWRLGRPEIAQMFRNERRLPGKPEAIARGRSYGAAGASP
jgi:hypothetical protein